MSYFPLRTHSHYSIHLATSKADDIVKRITQLDLAGCCITDIGSISGCVEFFKTLKEGGKRGILGCDAYVCAGSALDKSKENRKLYPLTLIAKSLTGWHNLVKIVSDSNRPERVYHKPRIDDAYLHDANLEGLIVLTGGMGSLLADAIINNTNVNGASDVEFLQGCFGRENVYLEVHNDPKNPVNDLLLEQIRLLGKERDIPVVAAHPSFYPHKQDHEDQKVLLCSYIKTTFAKIEEDIEKEGETALGFFFRSNNYYIRSYEEMQQLYSEEELANTLKVAAACEDYNILSPPILPNFECPNNLSPDDYFRQLCREGWKKRIQDKVKPEQIQEYTDRAKEEIGVLQGAGLSSYFLVVVDILDFIRSKGWMAGCRGSVYGCLVAYLMGIIKMNPIPYNLLFPRFYNKARAGSMPDIDIDVPTTKRAEIYKYIKNKYGESKVAQLANFNTLRGRSALKEVLRVHGGISSTEQNLITECIPDPAKVADELQEMEEETGDSSIILWALENRASKLREWCYLDEEGKLQGPLAKRFEQAIRLEDTIVSQSKHAAAVIISNTDLSKICPMIYDPKTKLQIVGYEKTAAEAIGLPKYDLLGLAAYDKLMGVQQILACGDIKHEEVICSSTS